MPVVNSISALDHCDTLMLDMDGTLLDLAFDNFMWLEHIPAVFAAEKGLSEDQAKKQLRDTFLRLEGKLSWYCLDHWSDQLDLDIVRLHREQNARIDYLPGAQSFLASLAGRDLRLLLVTNSHQKTLDIKNDVTGITQYFDEIYTSHALGHAKEDQPFWHALADAEDFDKRRCLFVDDNPAVLASAREFGIASLLQVTRPDSGRPPRVQNDYQGIESVSELID